MLIYKMMMQQELNVTGKFEDHCPPFLISFHDPAFCISDPKSNLYTYRIMLWHNWVHHSAINPSGKGIRVIRYSITRQSYIGLPRNGI